MEHRRLLKRVTTVLGAMPEVLALFLYGSFARGDQGPKSDVDLLILVRKPDQAHLVTGRLAELDFGRELQPLVRSLDQLNRTDHGLLRNAFREGRLLFLRGPLDIPASQVLRLRPFSLYVFSLKGLSQPRKAKFNRLLYPHKTSRYQYPGMLAELGGTRVASGAFLLPEGARSRMERTFRRHRVSFQSRQVWI